MDKGPLHGHLNISLPQGLGLNAMEGVLGGHYSSSKGAAAARFNFSRVQWVDVFQLSRLALWLTELAESGVALEFVPPRDGDVGRFLRQSGFESLVRAWQDSTRPVGAKDEDTGGRLELDPAPFLPITFIDKSAVAGLLTGLRQEDRLRKLLEYSSQAHIVGSGAIRDVVIAELADNLFSHAGGRHAHLQMARLTAMHRPVPFRHRKAPVPDLEYHERKYLNRIAGAGYIALVVADGGPGLATTLRKAYLEDRIIPARNPKPTEGDLVEYAFLYHSTRRSLEERLGGLTRVLQSPEAFPPPTGLFRLLRVVHEFGGYLQVRTGAVAYLYDGSTDDGEAVTLTRTHGRHRLTRFPGTQFCLYFPLIRPRRREFSSSQVFSRNRAAPTYSYVRVVPPTLVGGATPLDPTSQEASALLEALDAVERQRLLRKTGAALIDGTRLAEFTSKSVHYLALELMRRQDRSWTNILAETDISLHRALSDSTTRLDPDSRALTLVDPLGNMSFLTSLDDGLLSGALDADNLRHTLTPSQSDHLVRFDESQGRADYLHSSTAVISAVERNVSHTLAQALSSPSYGVFSPDAKVLLPSAYYCRGYFQVGQLAPAGLSELAIQWIRLRIQLAQPTIVLSIGDTTTAITKAALQQLSLGPLGPPRHLVLPVRFSDRDLARVGIRVSARDSVLIVTGVIGTGQQLPRVLTFLGFGQPPRVVALIDARRQTAYDSVIDAHSGRYSVAAALRHPLPYFERLPPDWLYNDVSLVDPNTGDLLPGQKKGDGPLWSGASGQGELEFGPRHEFIDKVLGPAGACRIGHFESPSDHNLYHFDMRLVAELASVDIGDAIAADVHQSLNSIGERPRVSAIVYPAFSQGLDAVAARVSSKLAGAPIVGVTGFAPPQPALQGLPEAVVAIDDAARSGGTLLELYEYCDGFRVGYLFAYVLVKRGTERRLDRVLKVSKYGRMLTHCRYLAEIQIPTYSADNCPACRWRAELEALRPRVEIQALRDFLDVEIKQLAPTSISAADQSRPTADWHRQVTFRWLLEMGRSAEGLEARHVLSKLLTKPLERPAVLDLFRVLARERMVFLWDPNVRSQIYYHTFAHRIRRAVADLLNDSETLSACDLEAVCVVASALDPEGFVTAFAHVLAAKRREPEAIGRLVITILTGPMADIPLAKRVAMLSSAEELLATYEDALTTVRGTLTGVRTYWNARDREVIRSQEDRLASYRRLTRSAFHEVGHLLQQIEWSVSSKVLDQNEVRRGVDLLSTELTKAAADWQRFRAADPEDGLVKRGDDLIAHIDQLTSSCRAITFGSLALTGFEDPSALRALDEHLRELFNCIYGPEGLLALFKLFRTNIKSTVRHALRQATKQDSTATLLPHMFFPVEAVVVFGEGASILLVLQNIIDNAIAAHASRLRLELTTCGSRSVATLAVWDDGDGVPEPAPYGHGHERIDQIAALYSGRFTIRRTHLHEPNAEYRTVATIELPWLPTIGDPSRG